METTQVKPVEILLVEDNPGDAALMREYLNECKVYAHLHVAGDGIEAMNFLRNRDPNSHTPRPDLIILDLNLPRKDGREVLAEIKADPDLRRIPVVILTSSAADEDVLKCYNTHANCYITKPVDFAQFCKVVSSIEEFWFMIVTLPPKR